MASSGWHRSGRLQRGLLAILAGAMGGCCTAPHWYEIFNEGNNRVRALPQKYAKRKLKSGYLDHRTCVELCGGEVEDCHVAQSKHAAVKGDRVAVCHYAGSERCWADGLGRMPSGRRPAGLVEGPTERLLALAHLEAASVVAFERLAVDLARLGAPASLVARTRRAAGDERRHARAVARLAGQPVPAVAVAPESAPSLFEIALENAVEGCVNETFGALLAWHQAHHAPPPARQVFARIAPDETTHGALAWAIHRWVWPQLSGAEQAQITRAMAEAAQALTTPPAPDATAHALGLPTFKAWRRLGEAFQAAVA